MVVVVVVVVSTVLNGGGWAPYSSGSCSPSQTYTASPSSTRRWNLAEIALGIRMQPCEAGYGGTWNAPCTAMP